MRGPYKYIGIIPIKTALGFDAGQSSVVKTDLKIMTFSTAHEFIPLDRASVVQNLEYSSDKTISSARGGSLLTSEAFNCAFEQARLFKGMRIQAMRSNRVSSSFQCLSIILYNLWPIFAQGRRNYGWAWHNGCSSILERCARRFADIASGRRICCSSQLTAGTITPSPARW